MLLVEVVEQRMAPAPVEMVVQAAEVSLVMLKMKTLQGVKEVYKTLVLVAVLVLTHQTLVVVEAVVLVLFSSHTH